MSPNTPNRTPIVRFLGDDAGQGGPFALLGLPHSVQSDGEIRKAQQRRLRQVDHHPHRATPDADEVRLAIHSAATQLLDPALREQLIHRWPEGTPVDVPPAWRPKHAMKRLSPAFLRRARHLIGSSGGWNPIARRRLAHLALINRVSALQVVRALGPRSQSTSEQTRTSIRLPSLAMPPQGVGSWIYAYTLVGLLACALLITVLINPSEQPIQQGAQTASQQSGGDTDYRDTTNESEFTGTERERLSHYTAIAHELDRLVARAETEPEETITRFTKIYPLFIDQWVEFPNEALERAALNISEMTVRLEQHGVGPEELPRLFAVSGLKPRRIMIVAALLEVILSSPELSTDARSQLRSLRQRYSESTIMPRKAITPVLIVIAGEMAIAQGDDDPDWWVGWMLGVKRATFNSPRDHTRLLIEAMGARLSDTTPAGTDWLKTASLLSRSLDWRESSAERFWLLAQFADSQVSTQRLSMLTEAIATGSAAEGIDARMVLPRDANPPQRAQIAQAYRDVWFPESRTGVSKRVENQSQDLTQRIELEILSTTVNPDPDQAIDKVLDLTSLWISARLRLSGEETASQELLLNPPELAPREHVSDPSMLQIPAGDRDWVEQVINCDSASTLRPLLDELVVRDSIGLNEAHALVYLATLRPQSDMRDLAQAQLERYRRQPSVLIAIDHALSDSRVSARLDELVRVVLKVQLPERTSLDWYPAARNSLLAQLASSVGEHDQSRLSMLPSTLHDVLSMILPEHEQTQLGSESDPVHVLERVNAHLLIALESIPDVTTLMGAAFDHLEAQRHIQRTRANSPMHRYLAELRYTFELEAIACEANIPGVSRILEDIRTELHLRSEASQTVLQQITNTQRAIAQLWVMRLERGGGV